MASSRFHKNKAHDSDMIDSLSHAIAIRDAIFHDDKYRQGEAYIGAVKLFVCHLTKDELCTKLLRILDNYNSEQTKFVILSGSYENRNGISILEQNYKCISCPLNCGGLFRTQVNTKNPKCPYFKFLSENNLIG